MRKVYILIGTWKSGNKYIAGVFSSRKRAEAFAAKFNEFRTYTIKTEVLL